MSKWNTSLENYFGGKIEDVLEVQFRHFYHTDGNGNKRLNGTICGIKVPGFGVVINIARVHKNDMGSRKLGRTISFGRCKSAIAVMLGLRPDTHNKIMDIRNSANTLWDWTGFDNLVNLIKLHPTLDTFVQSAEIYVTPVAEDTINDEEIPENTETPELA